MENNSQTPNLDQAEARRSALIEKNKGFLEKALSQGISIERLLPLLEISDLLGSFLGRILNRRNIC